MKPYYKIWIDQCEAAQGIKEQYGIKKALGYLIGEKLVNFVEAADQDSAFAEELPKFIAEIKNIFRSGRSRSIWITWSVWGLWVMYVLMSSMRPSTHRALFLMIR